MELDGAHVLDLYAGSGAVGLEALSRGAALVTMVDSDVRAAAAIRRNISTVELPGAHLLTDRVERLATRPAAHPYNLLFVDPPYALPAEELADVFRNLEAHEWLAPDALLVVERSSRDKEWSWPAPLAGAGSRRYGEATLWYGRRS